MDERLRSHYESLARAIRFTRMADAKAAPALALQFALVGVLAARADTLVSLLLESPGAECILLAILLFSYGVLVIGVVAFAAWVYFPHSPRTGESLIYFEDIAAIERERFEAMAKDMDEDVIESHLIDQIHKVSEIASAKMRRVRCAFLLSVPSSSLWLILLVWGTVG